MRIDHLQLAMPQGGEDKAREFFVGVLGMDEIEKPSPLDERGGCWFTKDGTQIHVGVENPFTPQAKAHPAFLVADLSDLEDKLRDLNLPAKWDDALPDRTRFYTTDPHGNRIEFLKDGDGFSQR